MPYPNKKRKTQNSDDTGTKRLRKSQRGQQDIGELFSTSIRKSDVSAYPSDKVGVFSMKSCLKWFQEFAGASKQIGPEGMEKLCKSLNVEPDNVVMLILAHRLHAKTMGYFTVDEWNDGMMKLQCDSSLKLRKRLPYLSSLLDEPRQFKAIYRYAFDFAKEPGQRTMDLPTAKIMLKLLMLNRWTLLDKFESFLENTCTSKAINRDQWNNILEFSRNISDDLSNYDMDGAWPVLLDEFVEFAKPGTADAAAM